MERKNHIPLPTSQQILEQTGRDFVSTIRGNFKVKKNAKMQPSPDSPLTLPKQEEGSTSSFDGAVEEGRFIDDVKPDGAGKLTYSGKEFKSLLYFQIVFTTTTTSK